MFAYIPIDLRLPTNVDDATIRNIFQQLGYDIRLDESRIDTTTQEVRIGESGAERIVKINSNEHHRYLGVKNLTAAAPAPILKEVEKYAIFTGASGSFQANIYVTRATSGNIGIWCYHNSLERLLPFCERIAKHIFDGPLSKIVDPSDLRSETENFILYSPSGSVVCHGDLRLGRLSTLARTRYTDLGLLLGAVLLFVTCFCLHFVSKKTQTINGKFLTIDPLNATIRSFVENSWPPAIVAVGTLWLSLLIALFAIPRQHITWAWRK